MRVTVVAFDDVSLFQLTIPSTVFGADVGGLGSSAYQVGYCAITPGMVRTDTGLAIKVDAGLETLSGADLVIVPAWKNSDAAAPDRLLDALRDAHDRGATVIGLCLGAFVLGEAGLLDGRQATTHWVAREAFARRFPRAVFRPDVLYVEDERVVTSAGSVAAIDCCLNLVREHHGANLANRVARALVTPPHRQGGQAQYIENPVPVFPCHSRLPGVLEWALEHLGEDLGVDRLAETAHMSRRSFTRHFRDTTGMSVTRWINAQRVTRAQQMLETTDLPIEHIAQELGFGTALSMRQQFAAQIGTSPSEYRRTFFEKRGN